MSAVVIADSVHQSGDHRILSIHANYWRGIHAEVMTHRVFGRNARSSRAVPVATMLKEIIENPFVPRHWGANQKGMQAGEECNNLVGLRFEGSDFIQYRREQAWIEASKQAVQMARAFSEAGYHKQIANRLLEPFMYIDTLITATEWDNFFELRDHPAAEPHLRDLAQEMKEAIRDSEPRVLGPGQWHSPYFDWSPGSEDWTSVLNWASDHMSGDDLPRVSPAFPIDLALRLSVARCARISYKPFDGNADVGAELKRYNDLVVARPMHASPAEHQATPDVPYDDGTGRWTHKGQHRNLVGWRQYRAMIGG